MRPTTRIHSGISARHLHVPGVFARAVFLCRQLGVIAASRLRASFLGGFCLLFLLPLTAAAESSLTALGEELTDQEMEGVSAQQGVILDIYLRNNVTETFIPSCVAQVGTPNACRLGLEFADRPGVYLMLKEFYGTLRLKEIRMDAFNFPGVNTAYRNDDRFKNIALTQCLIPGKALASCNPTGSPAIKLSYPGVDAPATYDDFHTLLNIGRAWLEFDQASPFIYGYNRDTTLNSVFSSRMADSSGTTLVPDPENPPDLKLSNNNPAMMRFRGDAYVFGF